MKAEFGPLVKWKADDGGWRTGRVVYSAMQRETVYAKNDYVTTVPVGEKVLRLVQHSCNLELEWVDVSKLEPWQTRDEWEDVK